MKTRQQTKRNVWHSMSKASICSTNSNTKNCLRSPKGKLRQSRFLQFGMDVDAITTVAAVMNKHNGRKESGSPRQGMAQQVEETGQGTPR